MVIKKTSLEAYLKLPPREVQNYFRKYMKFFFYNLQKSQKKEQTSFFVCVCDLVFVTTIITLLSLLIWFNLEKKSHSCETISYEA